MTQDAIKEVLHQHALWLEDNSKGKRAELRGVNLNSANLYGADLRSAYLTGANLYNADLRSADLKRADMTGADLTGANLSSANLTGANLSGAYLVNADLTWAVLTCADLSVAKLKGAKFNCTRGIRYAVLSFAGLGEISRQWLLVEQDGKPMFHIGCFCGSEDELRKEIQSGPDKYIASRTDATDTLLRLYAYSAP